MEDDLLSAARLVPPGPFFRIYFVDCLPVALIPVLLSDRGASCSTFILGDGFQHEACTRIP